MTKTFRRGDRVLAPKNRPHPDGLGMQFFIPRQKRGLVGTVLEHEKDGKLCVLLDNGRVGYFPAEEAKAPTKDQDAASARKRPAWWEAYAAEKFNESSEVVKKS